MRARLNKVPAWAWLALLAAGLRFVNLGGESLWYDETFTAWVARLDGRNFWQAIQGDVHPPAWYLVEAATIRLFGNSEFALRLPAALFGIAAVLLVWRIALELKCERRTAFTAGLLAAAMPAGLYYSQDARMYPMLATFVLLATWAALRRHWLLMGISCVIAVYTQNLAVFYVLTLGIVVMLTQGKLWRHILRPTVMLGGVAITWLPWAQVMLKQARSMGQGFWLQPLTEGGVLLPLGTMTLGWRAADMWQISLYGVAISATLIGLVNARRWLIRREGLLLLAVTIGAPTLMAVVSVLWRNVYLPRALLPSTMLLMILWAYPLNHLGKGNRQIAQAALVPMLVVGMVAHYFPATNGRENLREWVAPVRAEFQSGDVIYHTAIHTAISFGYYLDGLPYALREYASDLNQTLTEETKAAMGFNIEPFEQLKEEGYRRAWLMVYTNPMSNADEFAFVERIVQRYPTQVIRRRVMPYAQEVIYLVTL